MKFKRFIVFTTGLTVGYIAGTAAGRERFEQITAGSAAIAADLGLTRVSEHLRQRAGKVVRASVDRAAESTRDGIDHTADRLESLLAPIELPDPSQATTESVPRPELAHANGSHPKHKGGK
jgi:hypothetical protein